MDVVGHNVIRGDAWAKVCGLAKYTDDRLPHGTLYAKLRRSDVAAGRVLSVDTEDARSIPGVVAIFTYADVPDIPFATAGHPYTLDRAAGDVEDRRILTREVRYFGDEIAVVVARTEAIAEVAVKLIRLEIEPETPILDGRQAILQQAREIHQGTGNVIKHTVWQQGDLEAAFANSHHIFEGDYSTQIVQHCALENHTALAYVGEDQRIVIVTSTQIPHICRRIVGQALDMPLGNIRVIKPFVGGGFGSKQDVVLEPLAAFLTLKLHGTPVCIRLTREETFIGTRTRNPIRYHMKAGADAKGKLLAWECRAICSGGGYASHGHSCIGGGGGKMHSLYPVENYRYEAYSTYTNTPVGGAMRAYGTPQVMFMMESFMEDMSRALGIDPLEFRRLNMIRPGYVIPSTGKPSLTYGIEQCIQKGMEAIRWEDKQRENAAFNIRQKEKGAPVRRGAGMALISYNPFAWPHCQEIAGARLVLNQDGSVMLHVGATEIGQGSDTALSQIAAETLGVSFDKVHILSTQDTDTSPFDTGAYSSRQTYVSGQAVKLAALELRDKILQYAYRLTGVPADSMTITRNELRYRESAGLILPLSELALNAYYNRQLAGVLSADVSHHLNSNGLVSGACFAQVEVDLHLCKVKVLEIYDVMDCGRIINPGLAAGQVYGCVSMGLGYALSEELLIDEKTGRVLNGNLLDYKLQTVLDTPDINALFVENPDPTGPFGNKGLGEPPTAPVAPAVRNAVLAATGVGINNLPLRPQKLFEAFRAAGLL